MSSSSSRSATSSKTVNCPQCGAKVVWDASHRFKPFCSERCKMIDLGAWATESYRVPAVDDDASEDDAPERP